MSRLKLTTKWVKHPKVPVWENNAGIRIHTAGLLGKPGEHFWCIVRDQVPKSTYAFFYKLTGGNHRRSLMATAETLYNFDIPEMTWAFKEVEGISKGSVI